MPKPLTNPFSLRNSLARAIAGYSRKHELTPRDALLLFYVLNEYSLAQIAGAEKVSQNTLKLWVRTLLKRVDAPSLQVAVTRALSEAVK